MSTRPVPGTVVFESDITDLAKYGSYRREVVTKVKDTPGAVFVITRTILYDDDLDTVFVSTHTSKSQKFLAVGGPLAGQRVIEAEAPGYIRYNSTECARGLRKNDPALTRRAILVFEGDLR